MNIKKYKDIIEQILKKDDRLWNKDKTEFNKALLFNLIDEMDETIISLLLEEDATREKFFIKIKDAYVFKTKEFKFFIEEHKVFNSYTSYANRIGLSDGKEFVMDRNDVVLNFPFKDCVLEGGQSTEEGKDTYFEYDEKVTKTQEKQGWKSASYNEKQCKREEIFYNEILAEDEIDRLFDRKALVNWKRYTENGEGKVEQIKRDENGLIRENLIIKGNNLLALHSLKSQFAGEVKLIYIDPPYNTGNDEFNYNDRFNHSTWLTFMKNRLQISKELLRDDGVIFVQCDDNEQAYLKVLMDEIFGRNNFVNTISIKMSPSSGVKRRFANIKFIKNIEFILIYKKDKINIKPINDPIDRYDNNYNIYFDGNELTTLKTKIDKKFPELGKIKLEDYLHIPVVKDFIMKNKENIFRRDLASKWAAEKVSKDNLIYSAKEKKESRNYVWKVEKDEGEYELLMDIKTTRKVPYERLEPISWKIENDELTILRGDFWDGYDSDMANITKEGIGGFGQGQKPERLIQDIISSTTKEGDIVLDFFMGSATTQAVTMKMNRLFIGIEQMDYIDTIAIPRLQKSINEQDGGDFIYLELAEWNEKAKEEINSCNNLDELKSLFTDLCDKYYLDYNIKVNDFKNKIIEEDEFIKLPLEEQKYMFLTMLDLNQLYVQATEMEDSKFDISEEDQSLTRMFYEEV